MGALHLEMFLAARRDIEASQFHILGGLQQVRREFAHNRIYPPLSDLIELHRTLKSITDGSEGIRQELRRIREIDIANRRIIYEPLDLDGDALAAIAEMIKWALPLIQAAIEEGQTIFNFVDENLMVKEVGILPSYVEEGYLLVPELKANVLHVVRYEVSIYTGADQQFRNLKTETIETIPLARLDFSPGRIKQELMESHRELPNPATYYFDTDLDFPFNETMFPVAKRKFLRRLYS
ncbi:MAG TPA: hypothetical protein VHI13_13825 [Candidatus Kapabacteria bacterium]|nr:hypothetical protein [Candidatus Kapabacteria bacterium]